MRPCRIEIIDKPELQKPVWRKLDLLLTFIFWLFYFYLLLPLITFILWIFGFRLFYFEFLQGGYYSLLLFIKRMGLAVGGIGLLLIFWQYYNLRRFGSLNRRRKTPAFSLEVLAQKLGFPVEKAQILQRAQEAEVSLEVKGNTISCVELKVVEE